MAGPGLRAFFGAVLLFVVSGAAAAGGLAAERLEQVDGRNASSGFQALPTGRIKVACLVFSLPSPSAHEIHTTARLRTANSVSTGAPKLDLSEYLLKNGIVALYTSGKEAKGTVPDVGH